MSFKEFLCRRNSKMPYFVCNWALNICSAHDNENSKTYHYHSIFWWCRQSFASGRLTFWHSIKCSIVTCNLGDITLQFVIMITFDGNVFSMHYGVPKACQVHHTSHGNIWYHTRCQAFWQRMRPGTINLRMDFHYF